MSEEPRFQAHPSDFGYWVVFDMEDDGKAVATEASQQLAEETAEYANKHGELP